MTTQPPPFDWTEIPEVITNYTGTETYYTDLDKSRPYCRIYNDGVRVQPNRSDLVSQPDTCKFIVIGYHVTYHVTAPGHRKPFPITDRRHWFASEVEE